MLFCGYAGLFCLIQTIPCEWQKGNFLQFVHLVWSILNQLPLSHVPEQTWPEVTGITSSSFTSWQVVTSPLPSATLYNQTYHNTNVVSKKQNLLTKYRTKTISILYTNPKPTPAIIQSTSSSQALGSRWFRVFLPTRALVISSPTSQPVPG